MVLASTKFRQLWDEVDGADDQEPTVALPLLRQLERKIRSDADVMSDVRGLYLLSYLLYVRPDRRDCERVQERTKDALQRLLLLDPNHALGHMYFGFHLYDIDQLDAALRQFDLVDEAALDQYFVLKLSEMKLCCHIGLHGFNGSEELLASFVELCAARDRDEVVLFSLMSLVSWAILDDPNLKQRVVEHVLELNKLSGGYLLD